MIDNTAQEFDKINDNNYPVQFERDNCGDEIIIMKDNQPVVKLIPVLPVKIRPKFGSAKGMIKMSDDFDEPLEELKEYME